MTFIQKMRQRFILETLRDKGAIRRADLQGRFEVSAMTAALDLRAVREAFPDALEYDLSAKTYRLGSPDAVEKSLATLDAPQ